ncbi:MAG: DUF5996 family protein [Bryobacterales bacterium]
MRTLPDPVYYAYAYPTPEGYADAAVKPAQAFWNKDLGEFMLPYEAVRTSPNPDETLHEFFQSAYEPAVDLAGWDRENWSGPVATGLWTSARPHYSSGHRPVRRHTEE